ncbi:MAG: phospholipase D family protein [Lachnospiraceae bacterium]|nr:phospholipase D family protein [Lachnospiraceae bacterium]
MITAVISAVLTVILCALLWKYPAAAILLPVFLFYEAVCLGLYFLVKKKSSRLEEYARRIRIHKCRCLFLTAVTDVFGLAAGEDTYFLFDVLCCADGIAIVRDLINRVKTAVALVKEAAGENAALLTESISEQEKRKNQSDAVISAERKGDRDTLIQAESLPEDREQQAGNRKKKNSLLKDWRDILLFRNPGASITLYIIIGAFVPFLFQPSVSESTVESFDISDYYSDEPSGERAMVISDNGEALEERIRLISQAEERIILSTFEIDADSTGMMVMAALMEAAERGVEVCLLADGFPYLTAMWGNPYFLALAVTENVEIRIYNSIRPWMPWTFMGRLHDKYLIVDDMGYILGGRNTFNYFLGDQEGHRNYDWDVLVCSEEAGEDNSLNQVMDYFESVWDLPVCRTLADNHFWDNNPSVVSAGEELEKVYETLKAEHPDWLESADYESVTVPVNHIELLSNPTSTFAKEPVAFYEITELMAQAEESVIFHTPYIICNDWMMERLQTICDEVEEVTMMTNSVANNGNPFGASDYARNKEEILETGVQILEFDGGISYHGKCFVIDDRLSGVGSFNWDMRSVYIDTELMLVVDSEEFAAMLREEMQEYEADSLFVIDADTSVAPEGSQAQEVSRVKEFFFSLLDIFSWARFIT